ncbi:MAG: HAMP domain-containing protein [Geoalkalibacter sp.]|uniref:HAMP domain-containing protein n=1 Tax=Geoalkalibacter sp. TaxID=3041440 RepID=UPI002A9D49B6|nr:HAMP domain-containing protein [Thermodesulfobacteriota bacterium]
MSILKNIAAKALVPVGLTVTGFVIVCSILLYSFVRQDMENDTIRHEIQLADIIVKSTRYTMLKDDRESLRHTIQNIGEQEGVEHVRIFNKKGLIMFSAHPEEVNKLVDKESAGCIKCHEGSEPATHLGEMDKARHFENHQGKEVLAITVPIYNEPSCFTGSCHVHTPEVKLLGTLDIGLSQEPLNASLNTLRNRLIVFCLMVMVLTVGGVSALLRRNVLMPVKQLVVFAEQLSKGKFDISAPEGTEELENLAKTIRQMARESHESHQDLDRLQKQLEALSAEIRERENNQQGDKA